MSNPCEAADLVRDGWTCFIVQVGYQYSGCKQTFWEIQSATMNSNDMKSYDTSSSSIAAGWNLNINHIYNFQEGNVSFAFAQVILIQVKTTKLSHSQQTSISNHSSNIFNSCLKPFNIDSGVNHSEQIQTLTIESKSCLKTFKTDSVLIIPKNNYFALTL